MTTKSIDGDSNTTFVIDGDGESWLFEDSHTFSSASGAAINSFDHADVEIILEGHAETTSGDGFGAIDSLGGGAMIIVTETGTIDAGHTGIALHGAGSEIDNRGRIAGKINGVYSTGDGVYFSNLGTISGGTNGVYMSGQGSTLINHGTAEIQGTVVMAGGAGETLWFDNYGKLVAPNDALTGGASNEIIHNTGEIVGRVSLGDGNDVLDTRWGELSVGRVAGGEGDDLLIVGRADYLLNEASDQGYDTVKAYSSYALPAQVEKLVLLGQAGTDGTGNGGANHLVGNLADNALSGLGGDDILDGGRGNDRLAGGAGLDTFVFGSRHDTDTIVDFTHGEDTIDLSGWKKVDSLGALLRRGEDRGDDLRIIAGKDALVIEGQGRGEMHADDFMF